MKHYYLYDKRTHNFEEVECAIGTNPSPIIGYNVGDPVAHYPYWCDFIHKFIWEYVIQCNGDIRAKQEALKKLGLTGQLQDDCILCHIFDCCSECPLPACSCEYSPYHAVKYYHEVSAARDIQDVDISENYDHLLPAV